MEDIKTKFIPWLEALNQDNTEDPLIAREIEVVLENLKDHIDTNYKRPEGMYSKVRKMIGDVLVNSETIRKARQIIKMSKADYEASTAAARKVLEWKNARQTIFALDYICQVVGALRKCSTFADRFVFLQLACGARGVELLDRHTSRFFVTENSIMIGQEGFAKKRGTTRTDTIVKPLLWTSPSKFMEQLQLLREEVENRGHSTRKDIAKSFSGQLTALSKHWWYQHTANGHNTGTHINRAIYANVAYKERGQPNQSLTHFVKHVLGHDTMGSAANYTNIAVAFPGESRLLCEAKAQEDLYSRESVAFKNTEGDYVSICKPPIRRMTKDERAASILFYAHQLQGSGVLVNRSNLIALGFQSKAIRKGMLLPFRSAD